MGKRKLNPYLLKAPLFLTFKIIIMKMQFIFTFEGAGDQLITKYDPFMECFLTTKEIFIAYAMTLLTDAQKSNLFKISSCAEVTEGYNCPFEWVKEWNGKIWLDDLEAFRKANGINTTIDKNTVREWMEQNTVTS